MIQVLTRDFGGAPLVRKALAGAVPGEWYTPVPATGAEWRAAARLVRDEFAGGGWLTAIADACAAGGAAAARLERVARGGGVVVTTGQQPGLFGGPLYTWSKAFSALALADELERRTGIPTAPVFWAATDDADYAEASYTVVARGGAVHTLRMPARPPGHVAASMSATPLGDLSAPFAALADAAGSASDPEPLRCVREAYGIDQGGAGETVGGAYVALLRAMLQPLGIAVLDASHPSLRAAALPVLRAALQRAAAVRDALGQRSAAIEAAGYRVQVQPVPTLTLVFRTTADGARVRIPLAEGAAVLEALARHEGMPHAGSDRAAPLGPNVLLRPVVERSLLPTVAYVAGPSEFAYFAQSGAVAGALSLPAPRAVPRWSGLVLEPPVSEILHALHASVDDVRDPHAIEGRVAREELPPVVRVALATLRATLREQTAALRDAGRGDTVGDGVPLPALRKVVGGFDAQVSRRVDRLERRYAAAVKRSGSARLHQVAVARASLFPNGVAQERALNIFPFLARYGHVVRDQMLAAAAAHARAVVGAG